MTALVLLKGMQSVAVLVRPFTALLPAWLAAEKLLSLALVLAVRALIGVADVLARERVRAIDVPFMQAISAVSRWGSGSKDLVAAMTAAAAR